MTADECRAKAEQLAGMADTAEDYAAVLQWEGMALEWRRLAQMAEWQDAILAHLTQSSPDPSAAFGSIKRDPPELRSNPLAAPRAIPMKRRR